MAPGPLSARVAGLCQEVGHRLGGPTQAQVFDVRRRLSEPLRVAIAGRLKSGKSTLVNALIGRRGAPPQGGGGPPLVAPVPLQSGEGRGGEKGRIRGAA